MFISSIESPIGLILIGFDVSSVSARPICRNSLNSKVKHYKRYLGINHRHILQKNLDFTNAPRCFSLHRSMIVGLVNFHADLKNFLTENSIE